MAAAVHVSGIDHVVLHVRDLGKARQFYVDTLGMSVRQENAWQAFLFCGGGQQVGLFQVENGHSLPTGKEMNHLALRLESGTYETVKAALQQAGVAVSGREGDPGCIYFQDPDGHMLQAITPDRVH